MDKNYKLLIAYDGTCYSGWQIQPFSKSIQELIQRALRTITRQDVVLIGSGRTDAGVHARGQVAHFQSNLELESYRFLNSLNALLPQDIRVLQMDSVPLSFHAQHSAISKVYHYYLCHNRIQSPFQRLYSWHLHEKIDVDVMRRAAGYFLGKRNFTSFANEPGRGSVAHNPIRTLSRLDIIEEKGGICLEFQADGFLYKMVRNIVGLLLDIASGKRAIEEIPVIFEKKDRRSAGPAAPPHGLFLMKVNYSQEV